MTDSSSGPNKMAETAPSELVSDSHGEFMKISDLVNKRSVRHIPKGRLVRPRFGWTKRA